MRILVVDPNVAFATLLQEELRRQNYEVVTASTGGEALERARRAPLDLALIDIAVEEPGAVELGRRLRKLQPTLRLMLIPMIGETIPPDVTSSLALQGVLPKPFFLPELPERIKSALQAPFLVETDDAPKALYESAALASSVDGRSLDPVPIASNPAQSVSAEDAQDRELVEQHREAIEQIMNGLAQESGADAVVLTLRDVMVAWTGILNRTDAEAVAQAVAQGRNASTQVARILGRAQTSFEQIIAGADHLLCARSLNPLMILAVVLRGDHPLGLLRHQSRSAAEAIASLCVVSTDG